MRKSFFEIYREFGHAPSKRFPIPDLEHGAVAGQIFQSGNMIFTQGMSRVVVVTGDTSVGLSTLITKAIVSQSLCLLALNLFRHASFICPEPKSVVYALQMLSPPSLY